MVEKHSGANFRLEATREVTRSYFLVFQAYACILCSREISHDKKLKTIRFNDAYKQPDEAYERKLTSMRNRYHRFGQSRYFGCSGEPSTVAQWMSLSWNRFLWKWIEFSSMTPRLRVLLALPIRRGILARIIK